jgi:GNAT superfamily N-acetyltransferase
MNADTIIRRARFEDLERIWDIRFANDIAGVSNPPRQGPRPAYLVHLLETGDLRVAERGGEVEAYAAASRRAGVVYLGDLFVDPSAQSAKLGQKLLQAILPSGEEPRCVFASTDFRALALYVRFGMPPRWPNIELEADAGSLSFQLDERIELLSADAADPDFIAYDAAVCGRNRPEDVRYWCEREQSVLFWCRAAGRVVGYGVVRFAAARVWYPEAVVVGPVGVYEARHAAACLVAVTKWAADRAPFVQMSVPGPHPGFPKLLAGGMKIVYVETYAASDDRIVDPARYASSGGDLF